MINTAAEKRAYEKFRKAGMTEAGACALIGNLESESDGFYSTRVEYLCIKRLKENGKTYTDESYTEAVDSGKISCEGFLHPLPGKQYGYGYAQWTSPGRKAGLYTMAKQKGVSIGDEDMQIEFLLKELEESYPSVLKVLKNTTSIQEASDIVLKKFEAPADCGESVQISRAARGQKFYDDYVANKEENNMSRTAENVLDVMRGWLHFSEANGKFKQIIDLYNSKKPLPRGYAVKYTDEWCDTTVSAAGIKAGCDGLIGRECGCEEHVKIFKQLGIWEEDGTVVPKAGWPIVYNWDDSTQPNDGYSDHIGFVESVKDNTIVCIEGNKGESVERRSIPVGWGYIRGFAKVKYDVEAGPGTSNNGGTTASGSTQLSREPKWVGEVYNCDLLNVRKWAGKEFDNIKSWPQLGKGNLVDVCDSIKDINNAVWYFIRIDGRIYGFVHSAYIKKKSGSETASFKKGDKVKVTNAVTYEGKRFKLWYDAYDVISVNGDRVVIGIGTTVTAAVNSGNLKKE